MISRDDSQIEELRSLVLGEQYERALKDYLDKNSDTERVAEVIVEAIKARNKKNNEVTEELSPIINSAIEVSINNSTQKFADILYPVIGAAVRKSVSATFNQLIASLNQVLTQNFSLKSIKWRYQAWRQGISYAQFLLMKTSVFQVEQVLLIHRETGLLLNSVAFEGAETSDPELVSSMLTAITDFVSDSFRGNSDDTLEGVRLGELVLKIEVAPHVILAAAVRGIPNQHLDVTIATTVESIEEKYGERLSNFNGDNSEYAESQPLLEKCLIGNSLEENAKERFPWRLFVILLLFIVFGFYKLFVHINVSNEHDVTRQIFEFEPNYLVVESVIEDENITLSVLRKPGSREPSEILNNISYLHTTQNIEDKVVDFNESGEIPRYQLTLTDIIRHNILANLSESESVRVWVSDRDVKLSGQLKPSTLAGLTHYIKQVDGNLGIDSSKLQLLPDEISQPERLRNAIVVSDIKSMIGNSESLAIQIENQKIELKGEISETTESQIRSYLERSAPELSLISQKLKVTPVIRNKTQEYNQLAHNLSQTKFQYDVNLVSPTGGNQDVARFVSQAKSLVSLGQELSPRLTPIFIVTGFSDDVGTVERNIQLSKERAENVKQVMVENGINANHIITLNISNIESSESISSALRRVTIDVINKDL
ncbi:OmpA family protein [Vibrio sp. SCSIO 43132]|uniref:OmpA family protein n=1 Tax=Vibrio sp. SCSIO 43132 TaxID=2779363 RepID=UPI001CAA281A|nr:OmpA family protein [Vibrio sp. SCSIO 43132]UAB72604.1 OmpA family protein [Vibrio sp. SCSIO 43132]